MGLRINTNVSSLNAQRNLAGTKSTLENSYRRLSSGERITRSGDDAAGLAISENLKGQIRGLAQASRNAQDGASLVQVAEGGLTEVQNILIRLRELGVQAASDTIGDVERGFLDVEYQNLKNEIQRITQTTKFGGVQLLDGTGSKLEVQVGINNNEFEDRIVLDTSINNTQLDTLKITSAAASTKESARENLANLDFAIQHVAGVRANYGALQNRLQSTINNLSVFHENISAANSRIRDADIALETAELTRGNIMQQASVAVLAQANQQPALTLKLI
jgi:flagellin